MFSSLVPSMKERLHGEELMDDPGSDEGALRATLGQFERINRFLTRSRYLARTVFGPHMVQGETVSLLDVGTGGGDFARWFCGYCRRRGVWARVVGIDTDPRVLAYAREVCAGYEEIELLECAAQHIHSLGRRFDFVYAGHLLHHLPDEVIPGVLRGMYEASERAMLANDLRRSRLAYLGYTLLAAVCLRHSMAFVDGRLSIRRGFVPRELRQAVKTAGLEGRVSVATLAPGRIIARSTKGGQ
jgi:2-polyprenyl-3-methyl-5-hydroxy-6-metoxy-1,4-benzoquinol methylase